MTPDRQKELEALCEQATPGPWKARKAVTGISENINLCAPACAVWEREEQGARKTSFVAVCESACVDNNANAAFIAAARTALPEALTALADAQAELRMVDEALARRPALADKATRYQQIEHACDTAGRATDRVTQLERELADAQAELARVKGENVKLERLRAHCPDCGGDYAATGIESGCPCRYRAALTAHQEKVKELRMFMESTGAYGSALALMDALALGLTPTSPPRCPRCGHAAHPPNECRICNGCDEYHDPTLLPKPKQEGQ